MKKFVVWFLCVAALVVGLAGYGMMFPQSLIGATFLTITDGTRSIPGVQKLTVTGATVGGANNAATLTVPQCSTSTFGACKVDGTTITASGGVITAVGGGGSGTVDWVSITDSSKNGGHTVDPTGVADSTVGIQAAIDYAFANGLSGVYCPGGTYKTTSTIYLDPPNDMRVNYSAPPNSGQFTMAFFGDPSSSAIHLSGCRLKPANNNFVAFIVGPGNGMRASDFAVIGPGGGYRGKQDPAGVGIGIAGASAGATGTLIENTSVENFYALYMTDVNSACCLSDSTTFRKVAASNGYYGIFLYNTQSFIVDIVEPYIEQVTVGVDNRWSHQTNIFDGNMSTAAAKNNTFSLSSTSGFISSGGCSSGTNQALCFTGVVGTPGVAPDGFWGTASNPTQIYNSFVINTPNFGLVPLKLLAWNATTNVASFALWAPWQFTNYGTTSAFESGLHTDLAAATTLYAAERVSTIRGMGVTMNGVHLENPQSCTTLFEPADVWAGQPTNEIRNVHFNYDISGINTDFTQAETYCQQAFPFIGSDAFAFATEQVSIFLKGGNWGAATQPIIIDLPVGTSIVGEQLGTNSLNLRTFDQYGMSYGQIPQAVSLGGGDPVNNYNFATVARGAGQWDKDYFMPKRSGLAFPQNSPAGPQIADLARSSEMASDFCGYEPCPWTTPNLSPAIYALVSGSLGALGTYPPIACRTVFKSVDWNTTALAHMFLRSASCPGYSYGQNLTDNRVAESPAAVINGSLAPIVPATISWKTSGAPVGVTFSNSNLTATLTGAGGAYTNVFADHSCDGVAKPYFEMVYNTVNGSTNDGVGLANPSAPNNDFLGTDSNGFGWYTSGHFDWGGGNHNALPTWGAGDLLQLAIDETVSPILVWVKVNSGNWNGVGGAVPGDGNGVSATLTSTGGFFPAGGLFTTGDQITANFGGSAFSGTVPAGWTACQPPTSTSTLMVNSVSSGAVANGLLMTGSGVPDGTYILSGSGSSWIVNGNLTISSETLDLYTTISYGGEFNSNLLQLDTHSIKWMFPGLGITIGNNSDKYTVTGVYPYLGYITVIGAATDAGGTLLHNYSCTSGCTIGQAPFSWLAY